ncbi:helix-turn-helix domain-containing protein [Ensifer soli]|uniref:helix-turn-helix domain-containing protein n=1 Tax=Ciceribacter sp. sgz301302 TaxID=3342379 RepID=UPI0035BBBFBE
MSQPFAPSLQPSLQPCTELVRQLRAYRLKVGLTQADIAWKLGFSVPAVSRWERGACAPDLRAIGAIVDFLRRADAHTEKALLNAVRTATDVRNIWEGADIRYVAGSPREFVETPQMRAVIGRSIRPLLTGLYRDFSENHALMASAKAGEIASVEIYGGTALSNTTMPDGFVQVKRMTFQSEIAGHLRCDTHSRMIAYAEAPIKHGAVIVGWDELVRAP